MFVAKSLAILGMMLFSLAASYFLAAAFLSRTSYGMASLFFAINLALGYLAGVKGCKIVHFLAVLAPSAIVVSLLVQSAAFHGHFSWFSLAFSLCFIAIPWTWGILISSLKEKKSSLG